MSCPHSLHGSPDRCSQCRADAAVRVVTQLGDVLLVDGQPLTDRGIEPSTDPHIQQPRRQKKARRK